MNTIATPPAGWRPEYMADTALPAESTASGVSWAAIIGGAFVAASLALILMILGVGLGLSSVSPWTGAGITAGTFGVATIVWLFVTHGIASGMGGYLAGRLRTRWASLHTDEVYFRDTAHGFLVWAVGSVITAAFLGSVATSIVSGTAKLAATTVGAAGTGMAAAAAGTDSPITSSASNMTLTDATPTGAVAAGPQTVFATSGPYLTDQLLRSDRLADVGTNSTPAASLPNPQSMNASRAELGRILAESMRKGSLPDADRAYAARVVAAQTGLSQADAEKRVDAVFAQTKSAVADAELAARTAADNARRAMAKTSLWLFVALLFGAFCASFAATIGGRQRDGVVRVAAEPALRAREAPTYAS
ncbi:MAG TPA: hypothetical protein VGH59_09725 [Casimicrobiaceae bacterium]